MPPPSRRRKFAIGCGTLLLAFVVLFLALPTRKIIFRKHYDVVSIATLPDYQNQMDTLDSRKKRGLLLVEKD